MKNVLFIGCGKGSEISGYPDISVFITGLEPSKECRKAAKKKFKGKKNIKILSDSIMKYNSGKYDEIYMIFPSPIMLFLDTDILVNNICHLLNENGVFTMYSEIWPDNKNMFTYIGCEKICEDLAKKNLTVEDEILSINELPTFVRNADFLSKATDNINLKFRKITAWCNINH